MNGGGTNPQADAFAYAAAQVKKAMEITLKLGGVNYGKFIVIAQLGNLIIYIITHIYI